MSITDIFVIGIFVLLAASLFIVIKYVRDYAFNLNEQLAEIHLDLILSNGNASKMATDLAELHRDFNLKFDNELAKKVSAVLAIGERPADLMKIHNEETGEDEMVPIDHGW